MKQENAVGDQAGEQDEMIDKVIFESYGLQIRQAQHDGNRAYQIIKRVMIEGGKFRIDVFIGPRPVKQDASKIDQQSKRQEPVFVSLPEICIEIA